MPPVLCGGMTSTAGGASGAYLRMIKASGGDRRSRDFKNRTGAEFDSQLTETKLKQLRAVEAFPASRILSEREKGPPVGWSPPIRSSRQVGGAIQAEPCPLGVCAGRSCLPCCYKYYIPSTGSSRLHAPPAAKQTEPVVVRALIFYPSTPLKIYNLIVHSQPVYNLR